VSPPLLGGFFLIKRVALNAPELKGARQDVSTSLLDVVIITNDATKPRITPKPVKSPQLLSKVAARGVDVGGAIKLVR
jgi:hypothetical protein